MTLAQQMAALDFGDDVKIDNKGNETITFNSQREYEAWLATQPKQK